MLDAGLNRPARNGAEILRDPRLNKISAFSEDEREQLGLLGLVPEGIDSEDQQIARVRMQLSRKTSALGKYIYLTSLLDNNETLFFRVLMSDPAAYMPIVYTPTVGEACQKFGHILRRPRGLYLSANRRGRIRDILRNWPEPDVRFIVVTDGERILGLGDLGANGMGIPIGKLALYTACAGVPPQVTLPIVLDVGTNNQELLDDPLYLGLRQPRLRGAEYDEMIEEFVMAVQDVFPRCCIQFEDFANINSIPILARYRDRVCCYNDDIQGTAAVAVAGIFGALRILDAKMAEQTFLFLGAGSAGTGIADLLVKTMMQEGVSEAEARQRCWFVDSKGLVVASRTELADFKKPYAHEHPPVPDFLQAIEELRPTAIIGVSTIAKAFNQDVIEAMARINERPIVFPYSNPTSRSECTAEEAYTWSDGRAIFAAGSPFAPVELNGQTLVPGQGNNVYIFPAVGMAVYATEAERVTDEMFIVAARAVAEQVSAETLATGLIYPPMADILKSSLQVAKRVADYIFDVELARIERPANVDELIEASVYQPRYRSLI
ncbi:NAD-dependent malic enzyme [Defluviicoccus vanus]|uniref:NAD-dependent malic enzyme n=1 Tax=Defluviicoccus vanus TaxID=111831 RepID=A0A7H1N1B7_9PROT|nr:NAD-dependent malic enzyme [Defluviicoccus vanus]QNT69503.1 NAD-dependent malic enzyme [Defluviicoccus vanus]